MKNVKRWYYVNEYNCEGGKQIACHGQYSHRHLAMNKLLRVETSGLKQPHTILHITGSTEIF